MRSSRPSVGEPAACPLASQIGTVKATTPLLAEPLEGRCSSAIPNCDPCTNADASDGNMFRLFLQLQGSGAVVKKEGRIYANTTTGQLTTTFNDLPELPVSDVQLHFNSGLRAGLATPQDCGTFTTTSDFTPWSTPVTPDATPVSRFNVDWNGEGGACPAATPFAPSFSAGTSNPNAGQFSPLTVTFAREDREQDLSGIQVRTPPGLLGMLSSVPLCPEPQASLGTCSEASQIGKMTVAAGPGSHPFYEKGQIYLTGPYKGAPFGLSIVVPTVAGPFNLGNVVVRAQIDVNPETTALTVTSDPLPQILDGIPLRLRTANVTIDRPGLHLQPDQLRAAVDHRHDLGGRRRAGAGLHAVRRRGLCGTLLQTEVRSLHLGAHLAHEWREPRREAHLPHGAAVGDRERQGRTSQAASLPAHDPAESVPRPGLRSEPGQLPDCVGRRRREGDHAGACPCHSKARPTSSPTVEPRSRTSLSCSRATAHGWT